MNLEDIWAVRDARSLDYKQKVFLFVLVSRGGDGLYSKWDRNAADMGMSKAVYYRTRDSLLQAEVIKAERRYNATTVYTFDPAALSLYENSRSLHENEDSLYEDTDSQNSETKENIKKNMKEEPEIEQEAPVAAHASPVAGNSSNSVVKERFEGIGMAISFESNPSLKFEEGDLAHSLSENAVFANRTAQDWRDIKRVRQLTKAENDYIEESARAYMARVRAQTEDPVVEW